GRQRHHQSDPYLIPPEGRGATGTAPLLAEQRRPRPRPPTGGPPPEGLLDAATCSRELRAPNQERRSPQPLLLSLSPAAPGNPARRPSFPNQHLRGAPMKKLMLLAFAFVLTSGAAFAQPNQSTVTQTGNNNDANVSQTGTNQISTVTQINGNDNEANVTQFTDNGGKQTSSVLQDGSRNEANVNMQQTGGGDTVANTATIEQVGNDNTVRSQALIAPGYNSGQHAT